MNRVLAITLLLLLVWAVALFVCQANATRPARTAVLPKTYVLVSYDADGQIVTSMDLVHWVYATVRWTNTFKWPITNAAQFFTEPAVPALHPTNGGIQ